MKAYFKIVEEGAFADYEFEAFAESLNSLFEICAVALFEAMADTKSVGQDRELSLDLKSDSEEELLFEFLAELIYIKDVENILFNSFNVCIDRDMRLTCTAKGDTIDRSKHQLKTDVKAVTYHKLEVKKLNDCWQAHVILDL